MSRSSLHLALATSFVLAFSVPAYAKKNDNTSSDALKSPLETLYACSTITDSEERLTCYDTRVAALHVAEDKKEIIAIDATVAKKIKKEAFGFNLPSLPKLGLPSFGGDTPIEALSFKVKSIRRPARAYIITLENGQVWRESGGHLNYVPKGDLTAIIKAKSMGSFTLGLNNGKTTVRGLKVQRVK